MPLPLPTLDSRTYDELRTEGMAVITREAPEWTDHNAHDPGITLLELFAWLAEILLFRADQRTEALLRSFLRLAGVTPYPARCASTVIAVRAGGPADPGAKVPAGTLVGEAGSAAFSTARDLDVSPAWLGLSAGEPGGRGVLVSEHSGGAHDVTALNLGVGRPLLPLGPASEPGDALRIGFDVLPAAPGRELSLHLWTPSWELDAAERSRLEEDPDRHHSARTVWEYQTPTGWRPFEDVVDETRALSMSGAVRLVGPADHSPDADGRFWIRCRLESGGYECAPQLARVAVNAVEARHAVTVGDDELIGVSRGQARQSYALRAAPVVPGSTRLAVTGPDEPGGYTEVPNWDRSGPSSAHYRLDPVTGAIAFGDGLRGRVPAARAEIRAAAYERGGGPAGNVAPGQLTRLEGFPNLSPVQPYRAAGGADEEPLSKAHGRALDSLTAASRAVTAADLAELAMTTPAVRVARARALPAHHPALPCVSAPGCVTVVVLPRCGEPPTPSPGLLAAVTRRLERRRPLACELRVVGPRYVAVTVAATLHAERGAAPDLQARAEDALRAFFDPLHGGEDGRGWPFGRPVVATEVLTILGELPGVARVDGLGLLAGADAAARCENVPLCPSELVDLREPRIAVVEEIPT
jgi:predicted phage baseplate assembly protein